MQHVLFIKGNLKKLLYSYLPITEFMDKLKMRSMTLFIQFDIQVCVCILQDLQRAGFIHYFTVAQVKQNSYNMTAQVNNLTTAKYCILFPKIPYNIVCEFMLR